MQDELLSVGGLVRPDLASQAIDGTRFSAKAREWYWNLQMVANLQDMARDFIVFEMVRAIIAQPSQPTSSIPAA